jgi:hypothetical protein
MMRRFVMVTLVVLAAGTWPAMVRAEDSNPNQAAAQQICKQLRENAELGGRGINVKYLNGTVWLRGQVSDQNHFNQVIAAVMSTPGVTVSRVAPEGLTIDSAKPAASSASPNKLAITDPTANPLRRSAAGSRDVNRAQAVPSSFSPRSARQAAMMQAVPPPPGAPTAIATPAAMPNRLPATEAAAGVQGPPLPMYAPATAAGGPAPVRYDHPAMPGYAWPSYAAYPNYAAVTYPKQYSPTAWPYIGPFYPYPQVPLGWRKVSLQWDDGWWWLDFKDKPNCCWYR